MAAYNIATAEPAYFAQPCEGCNGHKCQPCPVAEALNADMAPLDIQPAA